MEWKYENQRIYSTDNKGELMAEVTYTNEKDDEINIDHVYVNPSLRGKGAASEAMNTMVDYLRKNNLKATATCTYANAWLKRNAELYSDIISKNFSDAPAVCKIDGRY